MTATALYRVDIICQVDGTHGGNCWVWALRSSDGDWRDGGRVADLAGTYRLAGAYGEKDAKRVAVQVCHQCGIDRDSVALFFKG